MNIKLAPFRKKHLEISRQWMNDREICRLFNRIYRPLSAAAQKKWYGNLIKDKSQLTLAIEVNGVYVGNIGLKNISYIDSKGEYYILIGNKDYWGKGIGTKATIKFLNYIKKNLKLHKIYLHVDETNIPALKLYKKVGFVKEGILKDELIRENKHITMVRMAYFFS